MDSTALKERAASPRGHVLFGALLGLLFALATLDLRFLMGVGPRWEHPRPDLVAYLAAAFYYLGDAWRFPLFELPQMGYPEGGSVVYNDAIPIAALVSKVLATLTGFKLVYLGPWVLLCYMLQGAFTARLSHLAGNRSLVAMAALATLAMSVLIFLTRIEHIALASQFLLIWALCVYLDASAGRLRPFAVAGLAVFALLVNAYLFAMVVAILAVAVITAWIRGVSGREVSRAVLQSVGSITLVMLAAGYLATKAPTGALSTGGFGHYSWNLATLVVPPPGYWSWGGAGIVRDATGGQYEGESYLGLGVLMLLATWVIAGRRDLIPLARRHAVLACLLIVCACFAASNRIFIGSWLVADISLFPWMSHAAGLLRVGGRFVWPLVYVLTLMPALLLRRRWPPRAWLAAVCVAAIIQTAEAWPIRRTVTTYSRSAEPDLIGRDRLEAWLDGHHRVWQYPSWFCGGLGRDAAGENLRRETQIQLLAARHGLPTNSIFMARPFKDCGHEAAEAWHLLMDNETLYVFSRDAVAHVPRLNALAMTPACRAVAWGVVCSVDWGKPERERGEGSEH